MHNVLLPAKRKHMFMTKEHNRNTKPSSIHSRALCNTIESSGTVTKELDCCVSYFFQRQKSTFNQWSYLCQCAGLIKTTNKLQMTAINLWCYSLLWLQPAPVFWNINCINTSHFSDLTSEQLQFDFCIWPVHNIIHDTYTHTVRNRGSVLVEHLFVLFLSLSLSLSVCVVYSCLHS